MKTFEGFLSKKKVKLEIMSNFTFSDVKKKIKDHFSNIEGLKKIDFSTGQREFYYVGNNMNKDLECHMDFGIFKIDTVIKKSDNYLVNISKYYYYLHGYIEQSISVYGAVIPEDEDKLFYEYYNPLSMCMPDIIELIEWKINQYKHLIDSDELGLL